MNTQTKMSLGAVLACLGALAMVLSLLLGWSEAQRPWGFLLGFGVGVAAGLGSTLVLVGLIEYRRSR